MRNRMRSVARNTQVVVYFPLDLEDLLPMLKDVYKRQHTHTHRGNFGFHQLQLRQYIYSTVHDLLHHRNHVCNVRNHSYEQQR